jgi:D-alanine-D-alanine ligase
MGDKIRIILLYGGADPTSGPSIDGGALDEKKYETAAVHILSQNEYPDPTVQPSCGVLFPMMDMDWAKGNPGLLFGYVEQTGLPWAGPGFRQAVIGMDRLLIRRLMAQEGLSQSLFRGFTRLQWERDAAFYTMEIEISLGYPCVLRNACSSIQAASIKVHNRAELESAVSGLFAGGSRILAEEWVGGSTYMVALLGGSEPEASIAGEWSAVQDDIGSYGLTAAELPADYDLSIRKLAQQACLSLYADGPVLVQVVHSKENNRLYVESVELFPDIRPNSIFAGLWKLSGKPYPALADRLVELAMERHELTGQGR